MKRWLGLALCMAMTLACAQTNDGLTVSVNKAGYWGVKDAQGKVIIPFAYRRIEHLSAHQRFMVSTGRDDAHQLHGYLDESGKVVVPAVYDQVERISNMGDEPTNIVKQKGQFGYVNILTGAVLIPPSYDALVVDSLMTDAQGQGLAFAKKGGRWGVLKTDGSVLVPFAYDHLGDFSSSGTVAERQGKLVQLKFAGSTFLGESDVPDIYSSNFAPRPRPALNSLPMDGMYVATDYPDMPSAWRADKANVLRWTARPSIQLNGNEAYVAFGIFAQARLPMLPNVMGVTRQDNGFTLMLEVNDNPQGLPQATPFLTFERQGPAMHCLECEGFNLPTQWQRVQMPTSSFGGLGIALRKRAQDEGIVLEEVLAGGPADKAGLKAGDAITAIDGQAVGPLTADAARHALRGPAGSRVQLQVRSGGTLREVSIERAEIKAP